MSDSPDIIYSRLVADEKLKSGSAYERLAAFVFHILYEAATIHDLRLVGESEAKHQIDVVVEKAGHSSRVLIECKDYSTTVGLGIVRDFLGVVKDTNPDEAFVVTTVGFSPDAMKFAAAHGIKLAWLRAPENEDWEN